MLHPSTKRLIDKLSDMTRKQRVTWTEGENASVVHDTEGYRVVITAEPHAVLLTDALGREIETCSPDEFSDEVDTHGRPYAKFVGELYREAARHARGTEKAIRTLLAGLDAVESEPPAPAAATTQTLVVVDAPDPTTDETTTMESETEITAAVATLADKINAAPSELAPTAGAAEEMALVPEPAPAPEAVAHDPEPEPETEPEPEPEPLTKAGAEVPAPSVEVAPLTEEPGSFGTFGTFEQAVEAPEPEAFVEPETEVTSSGRSSESAAPAAEAATETVAAPEPTPQIPTLAQPISLSSIPFGFGLGAAQRAGAPSHPSTSAPEPGPQVEAVLPKRIVIDGTVDLPDITPEEMDALDASDAYPPPTPKPDPLDLSGDTSAPAPEPTNPRRFNPWN